jgi:NAD+ diphosphatase
MPRFIATMSLPPEPIERQHWFIVRGTEVLVRTDETGRRVLPGHIEIEWLAATVERHVLGLLDDSLVLTGEVPRELEPPEGFAFAGVRELFESMDESLYSLAGRAVQIVDWDRTHRFCGRCGAPTERLSTERARRCPGCGLTSYPRLAPAVITLVERDGKALLARNPNFTSGFYSILAGFVEPGESLEEAVQREIHEEVGIEVTDIRYFGSQPWPFPHSLMIGFTAQYAGGEITPDPAEIADAGWFAPDEFPQIPGKISISRALIDDFVRRMGNR